MVYKTAPIARPWRDAWSNSTQVQEWSWKLFFSNFPATYLKATFFANDIRPIRTMIRFARLLIYTETYSETCTTGPLVHVCVNYWL